MKAMYVNHETAEVYENKTAAMEAYRAGQQIDLYGWSETLGEWVWRGYWEV